MSDGGGGFSSGASVARGYSSGTSSTSSLISPSASASVFCAKPKFMSRKGKVRAHTKTIAIRAARVRNGKVNPLPSQCHISVTEANANVHYITERVRESFEENDFVLVSNNGLEVMEMPGTRGKHRFTVSGLL